ncbi:MAG: SLBB domain-containing protein [Candidatus Eisenbacteria bacterium]
MRLGQGQCRGRRAVALPAAASLAALVIVLSLAFCAVADDFVQPDDGRSAVMSPQYYLTPGLSDELQIKVRVWGEVNVPGLYAVPDGTDLLEVLSLAGGPTRNAKLGNVKLVRLSGAEPEVFEIDIDDFVKKGSTEAIMVMEPGDMIVVRPQFWPRVFQWTGLLSTLALIANVIVNATN